MFYIRKIKDEKRTMSQATNREDGFSSQQHFQLLWCLMPTNFIALRLKALRQFNFRSVWVGKKEYAQEV